MALKAFESSPGKYRVFCSQCGSPLWSQREDLPELLRLRIGLLNEALDVPIYSHAYLAEKATWYPLVDSTAQHFSGPVQQLT